MAVPTLAANTPAAGQIQWGAFSIAYGGVSYNVPTYQTDKKYTYWLYNAGSPTLNFSNDLPTLGPDDLLLFLNKNGIPVNVPFTDVLEGDLVVPGSILANAIGANQITADKLDANVLSAGFVLTGKLQVGTGTWTPSEGLIIPGVMVMPSAPNKQTITITGSPTGGTFTLQSNGLATSAIAYNASTGTVQTAVRTLLGGYATAVVSGSAGAWVIDTTGGVVPVIATSSLTGGSSPAITVTAAPIQASITASITATQLTVQKDFNLLGNTNQIAGTLTLSNGITRPTAAPTVYQSWDLIGTRSIGGFAEFGMCAHHSASDLFVHTLSFYGTFIHTVSKNNGLPWTSEVSPSASDGAQYRAWATAFSPEGGITRMGSNYYILGWDWNRSNCWFVYKLDNSFNKVAEWQVTTAGSPFPGRPAIGNDGTNILYAWADGGNYCYVNVLNTTTGAVTFQQYFFQSVQTRPVSYVGRGSFDFGTSRTVIGFEGSYLFVCDNVNDRLNDAYRFNPANGGNTRGAMWDGTRFWSWDTTGALYRYAPNNIQDRTVSVSYTWYDGNSTGSTHETEETTTPATFSQSARTFLNLEFPEAPNSGNTDGAQVDKANRIGVYAGANGAARLRQTQVGSPGGYLGLDADSRSVRTVRLETIQTGTSAPPGSNGFVGAANSPGIIKSFGATGSAGIILNGDGSFSLAGLTASAAGVFTNTKEAMADTGWMTLPLQSGWSNYNAAYMPAQYRKIGNEVLLRGVLLRSTGANAFAFALPAGYRPPYAFNSPTRYYNGSAVAMGSFYLDPANGQVTPDQPVNNSTYDLGAIRFYVN